MIQPVAIEIDDATNSPLFFRPLGRSIRGKYDVGRIAEPQAKIEASKWPLPIPSQRLSIDPDGNGTIEETLHRTEHAALKEKIERKGSRLAPQYEEFENVDLASWYYWMQKAVESGIAKVVSGKFPDVLPGKPKTDFFLAEPEQSTSDKLTDAINAQTAAFKELTFAIRDLVESK